MTEHWQQRNYHEAFEASSSSGQDKRAQWRHNHILTEAYRASDNSSMLDLARQFDQLQRDVEGRQAADAAAAAAQADPAETPVPYLQPTDRLAIITLNLAITQAHLGQYNQAVTQLEPLAVQADALAPGTVLYVLLLLLDLYLATNRLPQAADTLQRLWTSYGQVAAEEKPAEASRHDSWKMPPTTKGLRAGDAQLRAQLHCSRARLLMLMRDFRAARREVRSALKLEQSPQALSLKAQLECERGNLKQADALLAAVTASSEPGEASRQLQQQQQKAARFRLLNNVGCLQQAQSKHHTAAVCFANAMRLYSDLAPEQSPSQDHEHDPATEAESAQDQTAQAESAMGPSAGKGESATRDESADRAESAHRDRAAAEGDSAPRDESALQDQLKAANGASAREHVTRDGNVRQHETGRSYLPGSTNNLGIREHSAGITYNGGVQALMLGQYSTALNCFEAAAKAGMDAPYVWLRIAECLIALADKQAPSVNLLSRQPPDVSAPESSAANHDSSLAESAPAGDDSAPATDGATSAPPPSDESAADDSAQAESAAAAEAEEKLAYARQCLCTAALLAKDQEDAMRDRERAPEAVRGSSGSLSDSSSRPDSRPSSPSVPSRAATPQPSPARSAAAPEAAGDVAGSRGEAAGPRSALMRAVHRASVHLHLLQRDYAHALAGADALLEGNPDEQTFRLAHSYAADALYRMGKPQESTARLAAAAAAACPDVQEPVETGQEAAAAQLREAAAINAALVAGSTGNLSEVQAAAAQLQGQRGGGRVSQRAQSCVEAAALCALLQQGHLNDALLLLRQQSAPLPA